ncbi:MAG: c-type cytochrome [Gemmatimonadetes bacterium]|jgi:tetratricopeptide (TPR) repeat protein|nr:c-type cytochrome [Gemmatimonadota bacterium]MBT6147155.1 c-type cytochrome [Gemmatimonadota bacterium]MBT7864619.1 c-type cytochrome [Gemmatimonadota bacterium]
MSSRIRCLSTHIYACLLILPLTMVDQADGQGWFPEEFKNLTVVPEDIEPDSLQKMMSQISTALGVRCDFCHVREGRRTDWASDENEHKEVARTMMQMTMKINADFLNRDGGLQASCMTCHRGMKEPYTLEQLLMSAMDEGGVEAMVAKYTSLREEYYGRAAYDFGEKSLMLLATEVPVEAGLQLLRLNLEYYPESADTFVQLGNLLLESGDRDAGIEALEQAVTLDPRNRWARNQLRRAKKGDGE